MKIIELLQILVRHFSFWMLVLIGGMWFLIDDMDLDAGAILVIMGYSIAMAFVFFVFGHALAQLKGGD